MEFGSLFKIDPDYIESNLFQPHRNSRGKKQYVTANLLPNLFWYVKSKLTEKEKSSLKDYDVQVFIIETALNSKKFTDLQNLTEFILNEINDNPSYWIKGTEPYQKILERLSDAEEIEEAEKEITSINYGNTQTQQAINSYNSYYTEVNQLIRTVQQQFTHENEPIKESFRSEISEGNSDSHEMESEPDDYDPELLGLLANKCLDSKPRVVMNKSIRTRTQERRNKEMSDLPHEVIQKYTELFKIARDHDINERLSIFTINRRKTIPKLELTLLPYLYQNFMSENAIPSESKTFDQFILHLRLQNLLCFILLTDEMATGLEYKPRIDKAAFITDSFAGMVSSNNNALLTNEDRQSNHNLLTPSRNDDSEMALSDSISAEEEKTEIESKAKNYRGINKQLDLRMEAEEDEETEKPIEGFKNFCSKHGVILRLILSAHGEIKRRQIRLIKHTLTLLQYFYSHIKEYPLIEAIDTSDEISDAELNILNRSKDILKSLECYSRLEETDIKIALNYYHKTVEIWDLNRKREQLLTYYHKKIESKKFNHSNDKEPILGIESGTERQMINLAISSYNQYINDPQSVRKRAYKFHSEESFQWSVSQYQKFLEGLLKFYDTPVNNKKIAKFIGPCIKANHVRHVKGRYLRDLRRRSKQAKKPIRDQLLEDIKSKDVQSLFKAFKPISG